MGQRMSKTALDAFHELVFFRYSKKEPQAPVWAPQTRENTQFLCFVLVKKSSSNKKRGSSCCP